MIKFIEDNAECLGAIFAAIIGGIFSLFKKNGGKKQTIKNVNNSNVIQTGDNSTINNNSIINNKE